METAIKNEKSRVRKAKRRPPPSMEIPKEQAA
jgi:hypothetical protein